MSLIANSAGRGRDLCVHLVTDAVDADLVGRIEQIRSKAACRIELYEVTEAQLQALDASHLDASYAPHLSRAAYFRLLIPDVLPESVERTLYLDSDTIVLADTADLFAMDIGDASVAGVRDMEEASMKRVFGHENYINTGVLLMNLANWRRQNYSQRCIAFAQANPERVAYADQCCINWVLAKDLAFLDPRWNGFLRVASTTAPGTEPPAGTRILHFVGNDKPWQNWFDHPLGKHYWTNLETSPWAGARPDPPVTVNNHHSLARKLAAFNRHAEACEVYEIVVSHLLTRAAERRAKDAARDAAG